jgi:hypothetical protein
MFLFRFLLFLILFYLLAKFIGRLLFGYSRRSSEHYAHSNARHHDRREGDVFVDFNPGKKDKKIRKEEGEYINYEEIKE